MYGGVRCCTGKPSLIRACRTFIAMVRALRRGSCSAAALALTSRVRVQLGLMPTPLRVVGLAAMEI